MHGHNLFWLFLWFLMMAIFLQHKAWKALNRFHMGCYGFGFVVQQTTVTLVNIPEFAHNTSLTPPLRHLLKRVKSGEMRGSNVVSIGTIMEFHANKLSQLAVTVQWLGSTPVTWQLRASSLSEAIIRKWSYAMINIGFFRFNHLVELRYFCMGL